MIRIERQATQTKLLLYGPIIETWWDEGFDAEGVRRALGEIHGLLDVHLHSVGGDVWECLAVYQALNEYAPAVTMHVDGLAASAASIPACAGGRLVMPSQAYLMIHDALLWGWFAMRAAELRREANLLDKLGGTLADIYAKRSGQTAERFAALMAAETYLTAAECVELGLASAVSDDPVTEESAGDLEMILPPDASPPGPEARAPEGRQAVARWSQPSKRNTRQRHQLLQGIAAMGGSPPSRPLSGPAPVDPWLEREREIDLLEIT